MLKIYYYPRIDDYVFENVFKKDYYDYDRYALANFKEDSVWQMSSDSKYWHRLTKTKSMELVAEVED